VDHRNLHRECKKPVTCIWSLRQKLDSPRQADRRLGQSNAQKRLFDRPGLSTFWRNDHSVLRSAPPSLAHPCRLAQRRACRGSQARHLCHPRLHLARCGARCDNGGPRPRPMQLISALRRVFNLLQDKSEGTAPAACGGQPCTCDSQSQGPVDSI